MYGVVEAFWMQCASRGLGLITGGADGCVRLWDVKRSSDDPYNGTVLAQCKTDIGHFTIGDVHRQERALVVGESAAGKVTIFDRDMR